MAVACATRTVAKWSDLRDNAEELRKLSHEEGFFMWYAVAEIYLGMIDQELGEPDGQSRIRRASSCSRRQRLR